MKMQDRHKADYSYNWLKSILFWDHKINLNNYSNPYMYIKRSNTVLNQEWVSRTCISNYSKQ